MFSPTLLATLFLAIFLLGLALGYIYTVDSKQTSASKVRTVLAVTVTVIWVIAMMADIFITGYAISPLVHAIMGAIVGYFFAEEGLDINIGG